MGNIKWQSETIGRCLTRYTRPDYYEVMEKCQHFFTVSQFEATPQNVLNQKLLTEVPNHLSAGSILWGVEEDGTLHKLKSVIDSSD